MKTRQPDWIFDETAIPDPQGKGEKAVQFVKSLCHPKSNLEAKAFEIPLFWERIIRMIYGPVDAKGNRLVKTVAILLPRGARKTTIGAALALLHTFGYERITGGRALVGASAEDQAAIAFEEAEGIVDATGWLASHAKITSSQGIMEHPKSGSEFRVVSSDGGAQLGKTPNFVLADELIAWKNRDLWKALRPGLVKVPNSLLIVISQAGRGQTGLAWEFFNYARKVDDLKIVDPGFLPVLFEAEADQDWEDERLWHKVNPGLSEGFPDLSGLRQLAREAKERPADRDDFKQFNLNMWLDRSLSPFVDMAVYDAGDVPFEVDEQKPCWVAVDLGLVADLSAVVTCWPDGEDGYDLKAKFFCAEQPLNDRSEKDKLPYREWMKSGHLEATPGEVTDYRRIEAYLRDLCDTLNVQEIAFDPAYAQGVMGPLLEDGFPVVTMRQGWVTMSPAIKETERAILARRFRHGGNPVLRWCFENVSVEVDKAGNKSFHKGKSRDRIDGAVAAAMAVGRASVGEKAGSFGLEDLTGSPAGEIMVI